jgi:hypothetical protein
MVTIMVLALAVTAQNSTAERHVRTSEPRILALIDAGISRSQTFRHLVDVLNASDVIVYVEPKQTRQALGGYLAHNITVAGAFRYVHIAIQTRGADGRLIPLLAHELQHAVEVAQAPDARDSKSLDQLLERLAVTFGCDGTSCSETQAAKDVEHEVSDDLKRVTSSAAPAN